MKMNNKDITKKSTYFYELPEALIAQTPLKNREESRMLCFNRRDKQIQHKHFYDIVDILSKDDVLVINNSRVLPARLYGIKEETGAKIEILLQKRFDLKTWKVIARPTKRLKKGTVVKFSESLKCEVEEVKEFGECQVRFIYEGVFEEHLHKIGEMPLPPYIHKKLSDGERYQTVYSKEEGSSAAPTAGLHFTTAILEKLKAKGVKVVEVLLHVGLGTFRPVKEDNILNHQMHSEFYKLTEEAANIINNAKKQGNKIIAVGTTSVRVLETCAENGLVKPGFGETNIFIYPGYKFKVVDQLITNFHLPESTLIMLVSAFCGIDETLGFYKEAVKEEYRFFSFGDCCYLY